MEMLIATVVTFIIGAVIGTIVEKKHNKKLAMKAWSDNRARHRKERY